VGRGARGTRRTKSGSHLRHGFFSVSVSLKKLPGPFPASGFPAPLPLLTPRAQCLVPRAYPNPLALASLRIYCAAMLSQALNTVNRGPAKTDCPGRGLGKTGERFAGRGGRLVGLHFGELGIYGAIAIRRDQEII